VVNATGPWADGLPHSHVKLRVTKGIHFVVHRARLPVAETVVMTEGKRILFAIPWGERIILGTTDTDYRGSAEEVKPDAEDIAYVLEVANSYFPEAHLAVKDILSSWAGLRPLIADPRRGASEVSRAHEIRNPEPGWWDVAGGKLTTYRLMGQQTVDQIISSCQSLGRKASQCRTATEPLLSPAETDGISAIVPPPLSRELVEHFTLREWAVHLDDIMVRRTSFHYYWPDAIAKAEQVADWMAERLHWPPERRAMELQRYLQVAAQPLVFSVPVVGNACT